MITTVRKLLHDRDLNPEDTVYGETSAEILDFPLTVGDFFELRSDGEKRSNFIEFYRFDQYTEEKKRELGFEALREKVRVLDGQAVSIKRLLKGEERRTALEQLKEEKRSLRFRMEEIEQESVRWAADQLGKNPVGLPFLEYKNRAVATSFSNIRRMIPELQREELEEMIHMPLLVSGLSGLKQAIDSGETIGFVGGPCLFGIDEVLAEVKLRNGQVETFDCSCGRNCIKDKSQPVIGLKDYLTQQRALVKEVRIVNRKTGITRQEYLSLRYLFLVASALKGKVVIPLPDLSYIKYMEQDLSPLDIDMRRQIMEDFKDQAFQITDLYLEWIEDMKRQYPSLEVAVLHEREKTLCNKFYEKRAPYLTEGIVRKITGVDGKKDAVIDYITMLALPYYFFGTRHVVQLDSLDETDSGRKCQKIHGKDLALYSILYPEFISSDGENTIYNTDLQHKEYLSREDYQA